MPRLAGRRPADRGLINTSTKDTQPKKPDRIMPKNNVAPASWLQVNLIRLSRLHFYYVGVYATVTVAMHAWKLLGPGVVLWRWQLAAALLATATVCWYGARRRAGTAYYQSLVYFLVLADIIFAAVNVYLERGMASRSAALFIIALLSAAILYSRTALFATASLATAAYVVAAVKYFTDHFNEGYNVELYSTVAFYSAVFFVAAALLYVLQRSQDTSRRA